MNSASAPKPIEACGSKAVRRSKPRVAVGSEPPGGATPRYAAGKGVAGSSGVGAPREGSPGKTAVLGGGKPPPAAVPAPLREQTPELRSSGIETRNHSPSPIPSCGGLGEADGPVSDRSVALGVGRCREPDVEKIGSRSISWPAGLEGDGPRASFGGAGAGEGVARALEDRVEAVGAAPSAVCPQPPEQTHQLDVFRSRGSCPMGLGRTGAGSWRFLGMPSLAEGGGWRVPDW